MLLISPLHAQHRDETGISLTVIVQDRTDRRPIPFASVLLKQDKRFLSGLCNEEGVCILKGIKTGRYTLQISYIGSESYIKELIIHHDMEWTALLNTDTLRLKEVVVTASESRGMTSSSKIDRQAMEHLQPSSFSDLVSLLPGERSSTPSMGAANLIHLREAGMGVNTSNSSGISSNYDISSLGTAFLMDGVPVGTKANLSYIAGNSDYDISDRNTTGRGLDMRTLSTDDIEQVEIVRGIPSVEYGDLTSGLVKIKRRKGGNTLNARFKADAYGKLFYLGKGFEWGKRNMTLNLGLDFLDSRIDPRNTLENYKRFNASIRLSKSWNYDSGSLTYDSNLDYGGSFDNMKIDPDINYHKEDSYKSSYNRYAWSNNLTWKNRHTGRFVRSVELSTSVSLQKDVIDRTRYVSLNGPKPTPPLSTEEGVHDGTFLTPQYVARGGVESNPFYAYAKLVARFGVSGIHARHNMILGADWQMNKNYGAGQIYDPLHPISPGMSTRPRPYYDIPAGHDLGLFAEDYSTVSFGRHKMELQAGLRASTMLNLSQRFYLHGKFYLDPRINLRWSFPKVSVGDQKIAFEVGGGAGWHTMTPSLNYLYPNPIYSDWQQLNYYHTNPDYRRLNLKTYRIDPTNYALRAARNFKWEVRGDILWGKSGQDNRLTITYFREDMTSGYRSSSRFHIVQYRQYDASGIDPETLTAPPQLEDLPYTDKVAFDTYSTTTNGSRLYKEGIEYQFVSKRIPSLKTRITIDGAWFKTLYSESESYYYRPSVNLGGESLPYMGHYNDPEGYLRNSFNTRFMFDTYLDKLKLGFSVAVECMWLYTSQSIRQTGIPFEYIDLNGEAHPFDTEEALNDAYLQWLIISYSDTQFRKNITEPLNIGVNLKVTKRIFKERIQLALFVDQLFSYWREYVSNGVRIRQTGKMPYFGMEINFSL